MTHDIADQAVEMSAELIRHAVMLGRAELYGSGQTARDAAAFITAQSSEIAALRGRVRELEDALEPFAKAANAWPLGVPDTRGVLVTDFLIPPQVKTDFTVGDLRIARAVLAKDDR